MISTLRGVVTDITLNRACIEVSGVGYELIVSPELSTKLHIGTDTSVFTSLVVREDSWTLFGFLSRESRNLFQELQSVTGIGPKVAYSLVSHFTTEELHLAIAEGNHSLLEKVPGIGRKVASRIILELQEKMKRITAVPGNVGDMHRLEVIEALIGLGFNKKEAESAYDHARRDTATDAAVGEILRSALTHAKR